MRRMYSENQLEELIKKNGGTKLYKHTITTQDDNEELKTFMLINLSSTVLTEDSVLSAFLTAFQVYDEEVGVLFYDVGNESISYIDNNTFEVYLDVSTLGYAHKFTDVVTEL